MISEPLFAPKGVATGGSDLELRLAEQLSIKTLKADIPAFERFDLTDTEQLRVANRTLLELQDIAY